MLILTLFACAAREAAPCGGDACCSDAWVAAVADPGTVFVETSVADAVALAVAAHAPTVAVPKGVWPANLELTGVHRRMTIVGQCREQTVLDGSTGAEQAVVHLDAPDAATVYLRELTLRGGMRGVYINGGNIDAEQVDLVDNLRNGVRTAGPFDNNVCPAEGYGDTDGSFTLRHGRISGTRASDGWRSGVGALIDCGHALSLTDVDVEDNQVTGLLLGSHDGAAYTTLDDVRIRGTIAYPDLPGVAGGILMNDGTLDATGLTIEHVVYHGLSLFGGSVHLTASAIRAVDQAGIFVVAGGLTCDGCAIDDNGTFGMVLCDHGGYDCTASFVGGSVDGNGDASADLQLDSAGIMLDGYGSLSLVGTEVSDNVGFGVAILGGAATMSDVAIDGTRPIEAWTDPPRPPEGTSSGVDLTDVLGSRQVGTGGALYVTGGAQVDATGLSVLGAPQYGVWAYLAGTRVDLVDATIAEIGADPRIAAVGVGANGGAVLAIDGATVSSVRGIGVDAVNGGLIGLTGVTVRDTLPPADLRWDGGLAVAAAGGTVDGVDVSVLENVGDGLAATVGGAITCVGCTISGQRGIGAAVLPGSALTLVDTAVRDNAIAGVVARSGAGAPATLAIAGSEVGPHAAAAVFASGLGAYTVRDSAITAAKLSDPPLVGPWGNALVAATGADGAPVLAWDGALGLQVVGATLVGGSDATALLWGSGGTFDAVTWDGGSPPLLQVGACGALPPVDGDGGVAVACALADRPFASLAPTYEAVALTIFEPVQPPVSSL